MTDAIAFLASLGSQAAMGSHQDEDYASAVALLDVDAPLRAALASRDVVALGDALGANRVMFCMIAIPDGSENEEAPKQDDDDDHDDKDTERVPRKSDRPD